MALSSSINQYYLHIIATPTIQDKALVTGLTTMEKEKGQIFLDKPAKIHPNFIFK